MGQMFNAYIIKPNAALRMSAQRETVDRDGNKRVAGEEWLVRTAGAYLPGAYEKVLDNLQATILTEKTAIHVKALKSFKDQLGKERKNGDSVSEFDEEKERSINSDERSNQKGQEMTRNSHQNIPFPGPAHYRLVPHYPLPVPLQYYRPVQYQLVPRPYAYINRGQHFYSAFI